MRKRVPFQPTITSDFGGPRGALNRLLFQHVLLFVPGHRELVCLPGIKKRRCVEGFTLVELLCVIAIIGILASIATPLFFTYKDRAVRFETENEMRLLEKEISSFFIYHKEFPDSLNDIGFGHLLDPWGHPYQYLRIDGGDIKGKGTLRKDRFMVPINTDYDLYSMGPDGKSVPPLTAKASQDDIIRANNGAFFGPASLY